MKFTPAAIYDDNTVTQHCTIQDISPL